MKAPHNSAYALLAGNRAKWPKQIPAQDANPKVPMFSILHTSARPDKWRAVYDDWMSKAVHPEDAEYVLCVDPRWGFELDPEKYSTPLDNVHVVVNNLRRCYVDGVNIAAKVSTGRVLIVNADDQFACQNWDEELLREFEHLYPNTIDFVIEVSTGTPDEHARGIMVMPILSRARYEQQGFVFYPEYESMFADNDFCQSARQDALVIDARHLVFPHIHPLFDEHGWKTQHSGEPQGWDSAYLAQNRTEAYAIGKEVFHRRSLSGFPPMQHAQKRRTIAVCLSGESFQGVWVDAMLTLTGHIVNRDFAILRIRAATSNVYITRETIRRAVMDSEIRPDLCLWLDDDNILTPGQFDQLLSDLESRPEVDGVSGWCWIHNEHKQGFMPSCGQWAPDHLHWDPFPPEFANESALRDLEVGGFPVFLMRYSALEKAGDGAFLPIVDNRLEHGVMGEDFAFFARAEKGGAKFLVDPKVRVPHLKYVEVNPVFESEGRASVKVACMIRAKNEGRWIRRVIESVKPLCGSDIYVLEDGSTDDTVQEAIAAGATVLESPFASEGLDERRDKNLLLDEVRSRCDPDWILMPDGDEELQPGGCEKIRKALETNPPFDVFALRILNLWDSVDQLRVDGVYGPMCRQSLFRAKSSLRFRSFYEGEGENHNHCGLHVSNAPGLGDNQARMSPLNVCLLHYGALHQADRLRKFAWITILDPHNEKEGFYWHMIQGDRPDVPVEAVLKHGGPLKLSKLPAHLVPKFDVVPGPLVPIDEAVATAAAS